MAGKKRTKERVKEEDFRGRPRGIQEKEEEKREEIKMRTVREEE